MKYNNLTLGKVEAIVNRLGGMEGVEKFLSGEISVSSETSPAVKTGLDLWKKIRIGTHTDTADLIKTVEGKKMRITSAARDMLAKPSFLLAKEEKEVELILLTFADVKLQHHKSRYYDEIASYAGEKGLDPCPQEIALQLRLQYTDQPMSERLIISFKPYYGQTDYELFSLVHDSLGIQLDRVSADYHDKWEEDLPFVFMRRK